VDIILSSTNHEVFTPPQLSIVSSDIVDYDIVLVKFTDAIDTFTEKTNRVCLPPPGAVSLKSGTLGYTAGFGADYSSYTVDYGSYHRVINEVSK